MQLRKLPSALAVILVMTFFLNTSLSTAVKNIAGTSCKSPGMQRLQDRDLFTCVKVKNKLVIDT
jgi:hypothetical protein